MKNYSAVVIHIFVFGVTSSMVFADDGGMRFLEKNLILASKIQEKEIPHQTVKQSDLHILSIHEIELNTQNKPK